MATPAKVTSPVVEAKMVAALAAGLTAEQVAKAFNVHPATVYRVMKRGDNPRLLEILRQEIREKTLHGVKQTTPKALEWLEDIVTNRTSAKDADALARALHALEKIASSASGEAKRVETNKRVKVHVVLPEWAKPPGAHVETVVLDPETGSTAEVVQTKPPALPAPADDPEEGVLEA